MRLMIYLLLTRARREQIFLQRFVVRMEVSYAENSLYRQQVNKSAKVNGVFA